jgi:hypothetical protein
VVKESESVAVHSKDMHLLAGDAILPLSLHLLIREKEELIVPKMKVPDDHPLEKLVVKVPSTKGT